MNLRFYNILRTNYNFSEQEQNLYVFNFKYTRILDIYLHTYIYNSMFLHFSSLHFNKYLNLPSTQIHTFTAVKK